MSEFKHLVEEIEVKVKGLLDQRNKLNQQVEQLETTMKERENEVEQLKTEIESLRDKNKILRIAGNQEGDNKEIKLKINEIVREVDKCIAQLNQ